VLRRGRSPLQHPQSCPRHRFAPARTAASRTRSGGGGRRRAAVCPSARSGGRAPMVPARLDGELRAEGVGPAEDRPAETSTPRSARSSPTCRGESAETSRRVLPTTRPPPLGDSVGSSVEPAVEELAVWRPRAQVTTWRHPLHAPARDRRRQGCHRRDLHGLQRLRRSPTTQMSTCTRAPPWRAPRKGSRSSAVICEARRRP
jgi:hypothetical protein